MSQATLNNTFDERTYVLDIETMNIVEDSLFGFKLNKMNLGAKEKIIVGLYDGIEYKQFDRLRTCIDYIFSRSDSSIVYAHNGGKYDYLYLLEDIEGYDITNIINLGSSIIFNLRTKGKIIKLKDSFKILPSSLKKLCKSFTPKYSKIEMNYEQIYTTNEIEEYLRYDCISLYEILNIFEKELQTIISNKNFKIDNFISIAGISFHILNKYYLNEITYNYLSKELEEWLREAYYGGRVEIYRFYGEDLNYYDINSMYPYVMQSKEYPIGKYRLFDNPKSIKTLIDNNVLGIVDCIIEYPDNYVCAVPYRFDHKLYFGYGKFRGKYTSIEIRKCISEGAKITYIKGVFWTDKTKVFEKFINDFYKLKENSTGAKRDIAKLILNTSYGKFGQKRRYSEIISKKEAIKKREKIVEYEVLGKSTFFQKEKTSYKNRKINPVYAIFVTAYARLHLFELLKTIGYENIFYCDTDSIICKGEFNKEFVHKTKLGLLKKEVEKINKGFFVSPKFYALDFIDNDMKKRIQIKIKGVDRDVIKNIGIDEFKTIFDTKSYKFKTKRMVSFAEKFNRTEYSQTNQFAILEEIEKELSCDYDKRIILGNKTYPMDLTELKN